MKKQVKNTIEYQENYKQIIRTILIEIITIFFAMTAVYQDQNAWGVLIVIIPMEILFFLGIYKKLKKHRQYIKCTDFIICEAYLTDYDIKVVSGRAGRRRHLYALSCQFDVNGLQLTKLTDYVYKEYSYPNYSDFINTFKKILYSESLNIVMVMDIDDENE